MLKDKYQGTVVINQKEMVRESDSENDEVKGNQKQTQEGQNEYHGIGALYRKLFSNIGNVIRFPFQSAYKYGVNPYFNELSQTFQECKDVELAIISDRRSARKVDRENSYKNDLLDVYLDAAEDENIDFADESIMTNIRDIFLAGGDTTAGTIAAALYKIQQNPSIYKRVMEDLKDIDFATLDPLTLHQHPKTVYLEAIVKESLRLYPPANSMNRRINVDTELGGYLLPKDNTLLISIYGLHNDPKYWGPDVNDFKPERWISYSEEQGLYEVKQPTEHKYSFLPFGAGSRVCLGFRLALIEAIVVVGRLLQATDISMVDVEKPIPFYYPVTLGFEGDLPALLNLQKKKIMQH